MIEGVAVLSTEYIIPFKMFAWLDLNERKSNGEHVNEKDLKKHKNDVFRLLPIVKMDQTIHTEGIVRDNIERFIREMEKQDIHTEQFGWPFDKNYAIQLLVDMYL